MTRNGETVGGNHIWSFFDTDIAPADRLVIDMVRKSHWPDHEVHFPRRSRVIPIGYNSIRSADLDTAVRKALRPEQVICGQTVKTLGPTSVELGDGSVHKADCVIDARGPEPTPGRDLGWQKFVGRVYRFPKPHGVQRPIVMDATVAQSDGYRFVYYLPFSPEELLIEDTYYSRSPDLDRSSLDRKLTAIAARLNSSAKIVSEESGVLPVVMGGNLDALWPKTDCIPRLGLRGGFFHPTTGYSLPDAVANAVWLANQQDLDAGTLADTLRNRSALLWRRRRFFRLLNRMLFRAAEPDQSYRVLQHFYRLSPRTIARFYGARLRIVDKMRILSGRPPVPIRRAIPALLRSAS